MFPTCIDARIGLWGYRKIKCEFIRIFPVLRNFLFSPFSFISLSSFLEDTFPKFIEPKQLCKQGIETFPGYTRLWFNNLELQNTTPSTGSHEKDHAPLFCCSNVISLFKLFSKNILRFLFLKNIARKFPVGKENLRMRNGIRLTDSVKRNLST